MLKIIGPKNKKPLPVFLKEREMDRLLDDVPFKEDFTGCRDRMVLEMFYAGEFILGPLRERLKTEGVRLCAPKYTPVEGASLLAAEMFDGEKQYIEAIRRGFDIK